MKLIELPSAPHQQTALVSELQKVRRPQSIVVDSSACFSPVRQTKGATPPPPAETDLVYLLPPSVCSEALQIEFVGLCITPPPEEGVQTLENRLELLTLPTSGIDRSCTVLNNFDDAVSPMIVKLIILLIHGCL
jgi:hypothetical protein